MADGSETAEKQQKRSRGKPFASGYDPRRNLKGVPAEAVAARKMIRKIGAELIHVKEAPDVEYDITRAEAMIRLMFSSKQSRDKEILLRALWPEMFKEQVEQSGEITQKVVFEVVRAKVPDSLTDTAPQAGLLPEQSGEAQSNSSGAAGREDNGS